MGPGVATPLLQCWGVETHVAGSGSPCLVCTVYQPPVVVDGEVYSLGHSAYFPPALVGERQLRARSGLPCVPCCLIWLPNRQVSTSGARWPLPQQSGLVGMREQSGCSGLHSQLTFCMQVSWQRCLSCHPCHVSIPWTICCFARASLSQGWGKMATAGGEFRTDLASHLASQYLPW